MSSFGKGGEVQSTGGFKSLCPSDFSLYKRETKFFRICTELKC
jgi:hypothetical protein